MFRYLNIQQAIYSFRYRKDYILVRYLIRCMRLLKQMSREYKGKEYHKHWIVIPNDLIKELKWDEGIELKGEVKDKKLVIERD